MRPRTDGRPTTQPTGGRSVTVPGTRALFAAILAGGVALAIAGCGSDDDGGPPAATPTRTATAPPPPTATATSGVASPTPTPAAELDIAACAPGAGPFSTSIDNPFLPLPIGASWILVGEEDGAPLRVVITALPDTEVVAGVTTRVLEEREWEDGELVEISRNFLVQTSDGTVCYYGEDVDDYEAGDVVSHDGSWRAGVDGAQPGILMPGSPRLGQTFKQEVAIGIAEDRAELVAVGESVTVGLGTFSDTIRFLESSPLDSGTSEKVYARGVGLLVDAPIARVPAAPTFCGTLDGSGCAPETARVDLAPPVFSNPTAVTNPLFPISQLRSVVLLGTVDGEPFRAEVTLLPDAKIIELDGKPVETLESQYVAFIDGRLHEVALDWYAQADDGSAWYFGEDVFNYEEGRLADTSGTWLAGRDGPAAMIMPAAPQVGHVYRPENIPGLVFEEVVIRAVGVTVDGPYGPVPGAIVIEELHLDGTTEDKTFAPGYGEFFTGGGGDVEALALAVPVDAVGAPLPAAVADLTAAAGEAFDAAEDEDWSAAAAALADAQSAWATYRATGVATRLEAQMGEALTALEEGVDAEDATEARQAAIDVARASLDFHLRHRPSAEVDRDRFELWARQVLVDADDEDGEGVSGDAVTLRWVFNRFAHTLGGADAAAIRGLLDDLQAAADAGALAAAAGAAEELRDLLEAQSRSSSTTATSSSTASPTT